MGSTVDYRLVMRATGDASVAAFRTNANWRVGDTVMLSPKRRYVTVEIQPGDETVEATLLVDELLTPTG